MWSLDIPRSGRFPLESPTRRPVLCIPCPSSSSLSGSHLFPCPLSTLGILGECPPIPSCNPSGGPDRNHVFPSVPIHSPKFRFYHAPLDVLVYPSLIPSSFHVAKISSLPPPCELLSLDLSNHCPVDVIALLLAVFSLELLPFKGLGTISIEVTFRFLDPTS